MDGIGPLGAARERLRILMVSLVFPWPRTNGGRIRAANIAEALSAVGEVDLFTMFDEAGDPPDTDPTVVPPGVPLARAGAFPRPRPVVSRGSRLRWLVTGRQPAVLANRNYDLVRAALRSWIRPPYDLVWFQREESFVELRGEVAAPAIVDLDVLDEDWIMRRMSVTAADASDWRPRLWAQMAVARKNARLFRSLHRRVAPSVHAMVVSAQEDVESLGVRNGVVIPNGFDPPERPVGRLEVGDPPTVIFNGILSRHAKEGAARYFLQDIVPLIRRRIPNLSVRMVGRGGEALQSWHDPPRVIVTGWVREMEDELARSDVLVAPMRYAGGTLLKVAEAFAHNIPVVATTVGGRGYGAQDGRHLLIGDTPAAFADACIRLLTDEGLRAGLTRKAHRLFMERYRWSEIRESIAGLARAAATGGPVRVGGRG